MAILRPKETRELTLQEKKDKIKELQFSLIRGKVTANKANAKTKEIKRTIARLQTALQMREEVKK